MRREIPATDRPHDTIGASAIEIVPYDPVWPKLFAQIAARVAAALSGVLLRIEHVGSTAVPGLAAKPVIDLDAVVAIGRTSDAIDRLTRIGYRHEGDLGIRGRQAFEAPRGSSRHHLYVVEIDSNELRRHLAFRDYLRSHPDLAAEYADLKRVLALQHGRDRHTYTEAKGSFVERVLRAADLDEPNPLDCAP